MFLLVVGLGGVQGHGGHGAHRPAHVVVPEDEDRIIKLGIPSVQGLEGLAVGGDHGAGGAVYHRHMLCPALSDQRQLTARDHHTFPVDYADGPICIFLQLQNYILKNSSRHGLPPHLKSPGELTMPILYRQFRRIARDIFFFRQKGYCVFGEDLTFFVGLSNLRNSSSSFSVKKRKEPLERALSRAKGPIRTRSRYSTGLPRWASIRFTWWNFPSRRVT